MVDAWNRVVAADPAAAAEPTREWEYDGLGRRIEEVTGTDTRAFYYTAAWQNIEERVNGTARVQYVWSPVYVDALVLRDRDSDNNGSLEERLWVIQDANYNVTALYNGSGAVVERYGYDPYGSASVYNASFVAKAGGSDYGWNYLHQGLRWDGGIGKYYNRRREYDPVQGRFTSVDPIGFGAGDVDFYRYVSNSPVYRLDPSGLDPEMRARRIERDVFGEDNYRRANEATGLMIIGGVEIAAGAFAVRCGLPAGLFLMDDGLANVRNGLRDGLGKKMDVESLTRSILREQGMTYERAEAVELILGLKSFPYSKPTGGGAVNCKTGQAIEAGPTVIRRTKIPIARSAGSIDDFIKFPKLNKGIMGHLNKDGIVEFKINTENSGIRGTDLFKEMMEHFGANAKGVKGKWVSGTNLDKVNELTGKGMPLEEAITKAWTANRARDAGFGNAKLVQPPTGSPGAYTDIEVVFTK